jgi:hypothetical protein
MAFRRRQSCGSKSPARAYNPLFIYGKVGLGKTHLLQAIGNHVLQIHRNLTVAYTTSERFTIELVQAIGSNTTDQFRCPLPHSGRAPHRRRPLPAQQGSHSGRALPHLQRALREQQANRAFLGSGAGGASGPAGSAWSPASAGGLWWISSHRIWKPVWLSLRDKARRRGVSVPDTILETHRLPHHHERPGPGGRS